MNTITFGAVRYTSCQTLPVDYKLENNAKNVSQHNS